MLNTPTAPPGELLKAIGVSDFETAKALLEQNVDPNETDRDGSTALHYMISRFPFSEIATLLVEKGADVNRANLAGFTPLMNAVRYNNLTALRFLIKNGALLDKTDNAGRTALDWANLNHFSVAAELITDVMQQREYKAAQDAIEKNMAACHDVAAARQAELKKMRPGIKIVRIA